jgi:ATP:ADP antiporter, AAA family
MCASIREFGRLRAFFWPIYTSELRQYIPIFLVALLLGVNYHILRNLKYGLLVLAPSAGAEAIPFVQLWGLVPGALLMTWLLAVLCRRLSQNQVFYITTAGFLIFFAAFQFFLYPMRERLEPTGLVEWLSAHLPPQLTGFVAIVRHWVISLFYVLAELWKVSILAVLFWGFVNTSLPLSKATRFYGPLMLASSLAGLLGGLVANWFPRAQWVQRVGIGDSPWQRTLSVMILLVIAVGVIAIVMFRYLERGNPPVAVTPRQEKEIKGFSMREAFATLFRSPYLLALGLIGAVEYVAFGLGEILWKDQLKNHFPDPCQFTAYTGAVILWASILSALGSAVLSGGMINRLGWRKTAMMPPFILLICSLAFYAFVLFPQASFTVKSAALFGSTPLAAAVFLGGVHNCLCRVAKNILWDPVKELAFVPLDTQTQLKGKAIIDGIGTHAGRAGGALVQQILLLGFSTVIAGAAVSLIVITVASLMWVKSASYVGKKYRQRAGEETFAPASAVGVA